MTVSQLIRKLEDFLDTFDPDTTEVVIMTPDGPEDIAEVVYDWAKNRVDIDIYEGG